MEWLSDFGADLDMMPVGLPRGADPRTTVVGIVVAIDAVTNRVMVSTNGSAGSWMTAVTATYTVGAQVLVARNPFDGGMELFCLGPIGGVTALAPDAVPVPPAPPPSIVTTAVTVMPTWSGTYRSSRSAWDRWNVDRSEYGGRSTLYQGDGFGSGPLKGLACYGTRITDLGALTIVSIVATAIGAGLTSSTAGATVTLQGSPHGSVPAGAPSSSGDTVTVTTGRAGSVSASLPSTVREGLRTGSMRGLCVVGAGYHAIRGTSHPAGLALRVTYTRPA